MGLLNLYVCDSHLQEYLDASKLLDLEDLRVLSYPVYCSGTTCAPEDENFDFYKKLGKDCAFILPESCRLMRLLKKKFPDIPIYALDHCFENLIDLPAYEKLLKEKAYIVTSSWLNEWKSHILSLGFHEESIREYFSSWCCKIVLLNSDNSSESLSNLNALSHYLDLPSEIYNVSIKNTCNIIENLFLKWKNSENERVNQKRIQKMQMRIAESEAVRGLINDVIMINNRHDLIRKLTRLWVVLFGVERAEYKIADEGTPVSQCELNKPYIWDSESNMMTCHLVVNNFLIGYCSLEKFMFPEKVDQYNDLIINLINISSIMISNIVEMERVLSSEKTLQMTFDAVNNGILSVSSAGLINYGNAKAVDILKMVHSDTADFTGIDIKELFIDELTILRQMFFRMQASHYDNKFIENLELIYNGHKIYIECSLSPVFLQHEFHGAVFFLRDVSYEKILFENKLKIERLEGLSVLSAGIAHEFNNLLTTVFGFTSLTKSVIPSSSKGVQYIEKAETAIESAITLSNKLITFSNGGSPRKQSVDFKTLLNSFLDSYDVEQNQIYVETDFEEEVAFVSLDQRQILIMLNSVMNNALDAVGDNPHDKRIEIQIHTVKNDPALKCDTLNILFRDNGCGIPEENLSKIFDPMFTTKYKAMGLGLSIAQSIVSRHNGLVSVQSSLYKGTDVSIKLPVNG